MLDAPEGCLVLCADEINKALLSQKGCWGRQLGSVSHPRTSWISYSASVAAHGLAGGMAPVVAQLLFLQLVLGPALVIDFKMHPDAVDFRKLHIDQPKSEFSEGFQGYCNGFMAYVRGRRQDWFCPKIHYVLHSPWKEVRQLCNYTDYYCDVYNAYCTLTQRALSLTVCVLASEQPSTSCFYNTYMSDQRLYLLCSHRYKGDPIGIISVYDKF
ncbi:PREDICTED: probable inactive ribonuclease-like protein 13 isoform X2 [Chinchilla lanigera]|uniref:probable inactive ribonuclease-like protein 13 isoform X2 n=1 Tax=Chinchilla lanigera TaxID=34839 RepID=UPI00038EA311|nr:PREDICTED: probable inactive ribonuclease-like protein 13 isoform X2 [Chinchilla lanigera]